MSDTSAPNDKRAPRTGASVFGVTGGPSVVLTVLGFVAFSGMMAAGTCGGECDRISICGNGQVERFDAVEACDFPNLAGETCASRGFASGTLKCAANCSALDTSECVAAVCGDGVHNGTETCDGADVAGNTCVTAGFGSGTLKCNPDCASFDTQGCAQAVCGNGQIEGTEACDGMAFGTKTCTTEGFTSGTLACAPDCLSLDTSACVGSTCGNGMVDGVEDCDGANLDNQTCSSQGFSGGTLACASDCSFDTTGCSSGMPRLYVGGQHGVKRFGVNDQDDTPGQADPIAGSLTQLGSVAEQMVVVNGKLVVAATGGLRTFELNDYGNIAPVSSLAGANTGFTALTGVAATSTEIFVAADNGSIRVFPVGASGNLAPSRVIEGPNTLLAGAMYVAPAQMWIEGNELIVTVPRNNRVLGFPITAGGAPGSPQADVAPTRNLAGPNTGFTGGFGAQPRSVTVANGELFVAVPPFRISVFDLATATGDVAPKRTIQDAFNGLTGIQNTGGLFVFNGELFVASEENASVRVFDVTDSGTPGPNRVIMGMNTDLVHPTSILIVP